MLCLHRIWLQKHVSKVEYSFLWIIVMGFAEGVIKTGVNIILKKKVKNDVHQLMGNMKVLKEILLIKLWGKLLLNQTDCPGTDTALYSSTVLEVQQIWWPTKCKQKCWLIWIYLCWSGEWVMLKICEENLEIKFTDFLYNCWRPTR